MTSSNFGETIIGEATMDAVNKLAENINSANLTGGAEGRENDLDARVADVNGASITINAGTAAGLRAGQTFTRLSQGQGNQGSHHRRSAGRANHADGNAHHHRGARQDFDRQLRGIGHARGRRHRP